MSERYSKLFALSENLYSAGAPVVIAAGALQKDNQTGKVFAQLKIRNIQDKAIKAATVKITPFDTVGKPLGGTVDYQYLDLSAKRDTDFGQKTPVMLKEAATRSFAVSVSEVIFSDNSIWTASNEAWEALSAPVAPEKEFTDGELAKQYRVKYGADCKCIFKREKDLWRCACGAVNHDSEMNCHTCQRAAASLAALNVDELKADRDKRLAAEQKKAAEEKAAAAEQAKKMKKIAMIVAPIVVVAIVAAVIISGNMQKSTAYNAAVALAEAGQYDEAVAAFTELGNYKDSAEQINEITYNQAVALLESGNYDEAISTFTDLGNYKDSAEQAANAGLEKEYVYAIALLEKGQEYHEEARKIFEMVGGYKDANKYFNSFVVRMTSEQSDDTVCTYIYNENGEISRMNCNNAAAVEYDYNEAGDLIRMGNTTYTYSPDKRTVTQTSKGSVYLDNYTIVNEYNEQGLLISSTRSGSDAGTTTCTYELNRDGTVAQKAEIRTQLPGGYEAVTTYEYGSNGLVSKEIKSTTYNYDQNHGHSPSSVQTLDYSYDSDGRLILAESNHTSYTYSQWSTDVKESTYHYTHQYTYGWVYAPNAKE
ncbi:MAG: tetratricopeptide repeat protein [Oscillospiraceae bacterium]|nr:tetratricopeptide repeat protein [Oscillospiraceae bacterium]